MSSSTVTRPCAIRRKTYRLAMDIPAVPLAVDAERAEVVVDTEQRRCQVLDPLVVDRGIALLDERDVGNVVGDDLLDFREDLYPFFRLVFVLRLGEQFVDLRIAVAGAISEDDADGGRNILPLHAERRVHHVER